MNASTGVATTQLPEKPPSTHELRVGPRRGGAAPRRARTSRPKPAEPWLKLRALALGHLDRFASLAPEVLSGDPDAIHDLRVASRRLEAALDLLFVAPQPPGVRKLRRRIKRARQALSEVRDCDALIARVQAILARKKAARRKAWTLVARQLVRRRKEAFRRAKRKIRRADVPALRAEVSDWLDLFRGRPALQDRRRLDPAMLTLDRFYARLRNATEQAGRTFESRLRAAEKPAEARAAHRARIAAKRVRYLAEILRQFEAPQSAGMVAGFREIQKRLGDWHDLDVLEEVMISVVARPEFLRAHLDRAFEVERLIVENRRRREKVFEAFRALASEERFRSVWERMAYGVESPPEALAKA